MSNERYYSSIGREFTVRFPLTDLSKTDQLLLLHNLMQITGTTDTIYALCSEHQKQLLDAAIRKTWDDFKEAK